MKRERKGSETAEEEREEGNLESNSTNISKHDLQLGNGVEQLHVGNTGRDLTI